MNVREVFRWAGSLRNREYPSPICAPECGPQWRPGFCDPDCPNAPGIEHLAHALGVRSPVHITSVEQYRELFGIGTGMEWVFAHHNVPETYPMPPRESETFEEFQERCLENVRSHIQTRAQAGSLPVPDDEWVPPGEAEGLPQWVENQIPEPCPECGLSQLGALTIRRPPAPAAVRELGPGRFEVVLPTPPLGSTILRAYVSFNSKARRLAKAFEDHAGQWSLQRKGYYHERGNTHNTSSQAVDSSANRRTQHPTARTRSRGASTEEEGTKAQAEDAQTTNESQGTQDP